MFNLGFCYILLKLPLITKILRDRIISAMHAQVSEGMFWPLASCGTFESCACILLVLLSVMLLKIRAAKSRGLKMRKGSKKSQ